MTQPLDPLSTRFDFEDDIDTGLLAWGAGEFNEYDYANADGYQYPPFLRTARMPRDHVNLHRDLLGGPNYRAGSHFSDMVERFINRVWNKDGFRNVRTAVVAIYESLLNRTDIDPMDPEQYKELVDAYYRQSLSERNEKKKKTVVNADLAAAGNGQVGALNAAFARTELGENGNDVGERSNSG